MLDDIKWLLITILGSIGMLLWSFTLVYIILLMPLAIPAWACLPIALAAYWSRPKKHH